MLILFTRFTVFHLSYTILLAGLDYLYIKPIPSGSVLIVDFIEKIRYFSY